VRSCRAQAWLRSKIAQRLEDKPLHLALFPYCLHRIFCTSPVLLIASPFPRRLYLIFLRTVEILPQALSSCLRALGGVVGHPSCPPDYPPFCQWRTPHPRGLWRVGGIAADCANKALSLTNSSHGFSSIPISFWQVFRTHRMRVTSRFKTVDDSGHSGLNSGLKDR